MWLVCILTNQKTLWNRPLTMKSPPDIFYWFGNWLSFLWKYLSLTSVCVCGASYQTLSHLRGLEFTDKPRRDKKIASEAQQKSVTVSSVFSSFANIMLSRREFLTWRKIERGNLPTFCIIMDEIEDNLTFKVRMSLFYNRNKKICMWSGSFYT